MSASQHSDPTMSSMPNPRGLVCPSSGGSKHEYVGAAALATLQMLSPRARNVAMSERMMAALLLCWLCCGECEQEVRCGGPGVYLVWDDVEVWCGRG